MDGARGRERDVKQESGEGDDCILGNKKMTGYVIRLVALRNTCYRIPYAKHRRTIR